VEAPANRPGCSFRTQQGANHLLSAAPNHRSCKTPKGFVY
jgi:hypothetical protein